MATPSSLDDLLGRDVNEKDLHKLVGDLEKGEQKVSSSPIGSTNVGTITMQVTSTGNGPTSMGLKNGPVTVRDQIQKKPPIVVCSAASPLITHQSSQVNSSGVHSPATIIPSNAIAVTSSFSNLKPVTVKPLVRPSVTIASPQIQIVNVNNNSNIARVASPGSGLQQGKGHTIQPRLIVNSPVRIAPQQPRVMAGTVRSQGGLNTLTLPPGFQLPQGSMLVQNEQGQLMVVPQGQQNAIVSSSQPGQQTYQIKVVSKAVGSSAGQLAVQAQQPAVQSTAVRSIRPQAKVQPAAQISSSPINHSQNENVKKCKNFLSTLIRLASNQPEETVRNVKDLIQGLVDGRIEAEEFTEKLQVELKSSPQPYLVPFLKRSLPLLRQSLRQKSINIDGVRSPPADGRNALMIARSNVQAGQQQRMVVPQQGISVNNHTLNHTQANLYRNRMTAAQATLDNQSEKRKFEVLKDDDDINDVATMGGVNLSEERSAILASNAELISTQTRSCKDEKFLITSALTQRIRVIARRHGIEDLQPDVLNLVSHATQERLRTLVERLSVIAEHRLEVYRVDPRYEVKNDVKPQLRFLGDLDQMERKRHDEAEREILMKAAKSRSKYEGPEQSRLKEKARVLQMAEVEQARQREANLTAMAAIGPRKKDSDNHLLQQSVGKAPNLRPRIKRVTLRDVLFLLEQDPTTTHSNLLYKALLK